MMKEGNRAAVGVEKRAGAEQLMIGAEAICTDGSCGEVRRVVIDPAALEVSHLVVEPKHRQGLGRLVPLDLVDVSTGEVRVDCTRAQLDAMDHAEETELLPASGGHADYPAGRALPQPYDGLSNVIGDVPEAVTYDTVPPGEVEVTPGEWVHATDGPIGSVKGVMIDPRSRRVTHLLLREGHVWGHKRVAIPADAVIAIDNGIQLNLSKRDVEDLRPAEENSGCGPESEGSLREAAWCGSGAPAWRIGCGPITSERPSDLGVCLDLRLSFGRPGEQGGIGRLALFPPFRRVFDIRADSGSGCRALVDPPCWRL